MYTHVLYIYSKICLSQEFVPKKILDAHSEGKNRMRSIS